MTPYSRQLRDGAGEVVQYFRGREEQAGADPYWYDRLAEEMRQAAELGDESTAEGAIRGIARTIIDSFPLTDDFAPSFQAALLAVQHAERRRRRERNARE
jgi:hypothetical protein